MHNTGTPPYDGLSLSACHPPVSHYHRRMFRQKTAFGLLREHSLPGSSVHYLDRVVKSHPTSRHKAYLSDSLHLEHNDWHPTTPQTPIYQVFLAAHLHLDKV